MPANGSLAEVRLKRIYCITDGLLNIFETQHKDKKASPATAPACKFADSAQVLDFTQVFVEFLNCNLNLGVFTGAVGANLQTIMKLDLAVQMSSILMQAKTGEDKAAFEEFIGSSNFDEAKVDVFTKLIQWIILNYSASKIKSSPAGAKIFELSQNIEGLLSKVSVSEKAVSMCLPILMKTILKADFKLRDLIHQSGCCTQVNKSKKAKGQSEEKPTQHLINFERALAIQRNVNILFLLFFKQWVQTDAVATRFLTELNGFDFLLDRLFSKVTEVE